MLPDRVTSASVDWLMQSDAARLFIERAQAVKPDFTVTPDNAAAIAEICSLVGRIAAGDRARRRPHQGSFATALLMRLERRLPLLTGGPRDQPARLRTMRDAIAWSYDLLDDAEQTLFRRLSVFVGGFTLEGAEAVSGIDRPGAEVFDGVASLIDKSLVRQVDHVAREPRFMMLDTIREFGLEQLAASGEEATLARLMPTIALRSPAQSFIGVPGPDYALWMERSEAEHNDFRSRSLVAPGRGRCRGGARPVRGSLYRFWYVRGHLSEGLSWTERALLASASTPPAVRSWAFLAAAWLAWATGDYRPRVRRARAAHELFATSSQPAPELPSRCTSWAWWRRTAAITPRRRSISPTRSNSFGTWTSRPGPGSL